MLIKRVFAAALDYYKREPARVNAAAATVLVSAAAVVGFELSVTDALLVIGIVASVLGLTGEKTRSSVTPVK